MLRMTIVGHRLYTPFTKPARLYAYNYVLKDDQSFHKQKYKIILK